MKNRSKLTSNLGLVAAGVGIGLLARSVWGPPAEAYIPPMAIDRPVLNDQFEEIETMLLPIDVPITDQK